MIAFGAYRLDLDEERVWQGPKLLSLRRKPFAILRYLVANPARLVTYAELLEHVWQGATISESAMRSQLHELRQVLGDGVIETVIGRGWRLVVDVRGEDAAGGAEVPKVVTARRSAHPPRVLVGREREVASLRSSVDRAAAGQRQVCFVLGEPGIGKTTLVRHVVEELQDRGMLVASGHCIEQHCAPEPYSAVIEIVTAILRAEGGAAAMAALLRFAPTFLAQLAHLVPEDKLADVMERARGANDARMRRELVDAFEAICAQQPLVMVLEDLQWSDLATIDLLAMLGQRRDPARLTVIATSRHAEAQTTSSPINRVMRTLVARFGAAAMTLAAISGNELDALVAARFPDHRFPAELAPIIGRITGGTPLFVTSLLDELVRREMVVERGGAWELAVSLDDVAARRPDSVTQLIDIGLDRLALEEQRVLEAASVVGAQFSAALVAAALQLDVLTVEERCDDLARRHLFLRRAPSEETPDGVASCFAFTHALVQSVCLERTSGARRQRMHRLVADALVAMYAGRAGEVASVIALHFDQARAPAEAIAQYRVAARGASDRHATADAHVLFHRALELVPALPAGPARDVAELQLLLAIGQLELRLHHADPTRSSAGPMFERTIALARGTGDANTIYAALTAACLRHSTLGNYAQTREIVGELEALAASTTIEPALLAYGTTVGASQYAYRGEITRAHAILEREVQASMATLASSAGGATVLPTALFGSAVRATLINAFLGGVGWVLGRPETAFRLASLAVELGARVGDTLSYSLACIGCARICLVSQDLANFRAAVSRLEANPDLGPHMGFETRAMRAYLDGLDAPLDPAVADELTRGYRERAELHPGAMGIIAIPVVEALRAHHPELARATAAEALALVERTGEGMYTPFVRCLYGDLLVAADPALAVTEYRRAHRDALAQESPNLVLVAATRLRRALPGDGEARAALERAIAAVPEGHALAPYLAARAALDG
jgi:DNA-binding winged helix-turn-helix (wHTH) protein